MNTNSSRKTHRAKTALRDLQKLLVSLLLIASCSRAVEDSGNAKNLERGCIQDFDPAKDYFPKKAVPEFAKNFSVEYHRSYKVVTVHEASQGGAPETYVLLQCGAPKPELEGKLESAPIVPVPVVSLFSESTTHHQSLIDLGRVDVLTGVSSARYVLHDEVIARIEAGKTIEYAASGTLNAERVIAAAPTALMASRNNDPAFAALRNAGIPVVVNTEWLEQSALGRAEWIKYIALYLNEEEKGEERFAVIRNAYRSWMERTANVPKAGRPKVTTGGAFRGSYAVAGGHSYVAALIADAGGEYVWSDNRETGLAAIDIETAIARAAGADYWINGGSWANLPAMLDDEPRYNEFKAYRTGQVWLYNRRVKASGANDYWSRGVSRPDLILADLIKIFHPDLARDHEFEWYLQIPGKAE